MAYLARVSFTGNASTTQYSLPFSYHTVDPDLDQGFRACHLWLDSTHAMAKFITKITAGDRPVPGCDAHA